MSLYQHDLTISKPQSKTKNLVINTKQNNWLESFISILLCHAILFKIIMSITSISNMSFFTIFINILNLLLPFFGFLD